MPRRLKIEDQLIIPFGRPKWMIKDINIVKVSPSATYIESDIPFAYINKKEKKPLQVADFWEVVPDNLLNNFKRISPHFDRDEDGYDISKKATKEFLYRISLIYDYLNNRCEVGSLHEKKFLEIYFNYWSNYAAGIADASIQYITDKLRPLLPLPQAHIYLEDGLEERTYMQKVDFAFWTGNKLIAVEIDSEEKLLPEVIRRDRRYREAGIEVIHILNCEIDEHKDSIMKFCSEELRSEDFFDSYHQKVHTLITLILIPGMMTKE